ncbi:hypothetical protein GH811_18090 [Acetobacterium malicum]|uniref:Uncharacterized protein n=1 Tax=Acetobacterium malicum TaxID=52692 RepID=A0ABR6Z1Z2_9FIRM|nr:hypothetical protein [Acetobacterium malicum]MBC3901512.1 hypothetical protein [Acetobacterium malicum]
MIYLIADTSKYEWPLATAGSLNELAEICKAEIPVICRVIRKNRTTRLFHGVPAKIYKFQEDEP